MKPINCVVIDDEQAGIDVLSDHLGKIPEITLSSTFQDPITALDCVQKTPVDLVFLDVDMPRLSGIEFIETLKAKPEYILPVIIITTAHDQHAVKGFEHGVADFLLKPITFKRLKIALDRIFDTHAKQNLSAKSQGFIFVESEGKKIKINFADICYLEAAGNYLKVFTLKGNYILYTSLSALQAQLPETDFARVHNSFLISIAQIQSVTRNEITIGTGKEDRKIPIGVTFREAVFKWLKLH
jgi:DNA-binding LytR/AlgR family response regulator